jgi:hypothetical protein
MTTLTLHTVGQGTSAAGPDLDAYAIGEYVYLMVRGPMHKDGLMISHDDARVLAACLAEWCAETGPEGA